jgi:hypothetical protein
VDACCFPGNQCGAYACVLEKSEIGSDDAASTSSYGSVNSAIREKSVEGMHASKDLSGF